MPGPLSGVKVVEIASIGPGPFCCMMLADLGAEVIRVSRCSEAVSDDETSASYRIMERNRRSIALDLKSDAGRDVILKLIEASDILIEGFRPGTMERLGLGPGVAHEVNPRLVYGRMTGWGQDGPLAMTAGHDINYIALSGALAASGPAEQPLPPLNLVGDFGGGAMMLALGVVSAVLKARETGRGDIVDAAMYEGAGLLMAMFYGRVAKGTLLDRGSNYLDGSAHYYSTYLCADDKWIAIGPIEDKFYAILLSKLGLGGPEDFPQGGPEDWADRRARLADLFRTKPRDAWCALLEETDACFSPVLTPQEAPSHRHAKARGAFVEVDGITQPAPAPRFQNNVADLPERPRRVGADTEAIMRELGYGHADIEALKHDSVVA